MQIDFTEKDPAMGLVMQDVIEGELVPFDYGKELLKVQRTFESYRDELKQIEARATAIRVVDDSTRMMALEFGAQSQALIKKIKVKMEGMIQEPNDYVGKVRNIAKGLIEPLESIKKQSGAKIDTWLAEERRRKAELEEKARREARELQDRLNREAREKAEAEARARAEEEAKERNVPVEEVPVVVAPVEEVKIFEPVVEQTPTTVRAESGAGTAFQKDGRWVYKVVDMAKVPVEFLLTNGPLINQKIKFGVREIPGLEIYQEDRKTMFRGR